MRRQMTETLVERWPRGLLGLIGLPVILYLDQNFGLIADPVVTGCFYVGAAAWFWGRPAGFFAAAGVSAIIAGCLSVTLPPAATVAVATVAIIVRPAMFFAVAQVMASLRSAIDRERTAARQDLLTGVDNRLAFEEKAEAAVARAKRKQTPLAMAFIDCDDFKRVNDNLGHAAGDDLLRIIGQSLRANVRPDDIVARVGGDEFAVIFRDSNGNSPHQAIRRLRRVLSQELRNQGWNVTLSIGVATFKSVRGTYKDILKAADKLQYGAKATGKNAVIYGVVEEPEQITSQRQARRRSA